MLCARMSIKPTAVPFDTAVETLGIAVGAAVMARAALVSNRTAPVWHHAQSVGMTMAR